MQGQQRKLRRWGIFALCLLVPGCGYDALSRPAGEDPSSTPTLGNDSSGAKRVIIKFRKGTGTNKRSALLKASGDHTENLITQLDMHVITVPDGQTAEQVIQRYANDPLVEFVEAETFAEPMAVVPDDPYFPNWQKIYMESMGVTAAWDEPTLQNGTTGSSPVPIAVIDSGLEVDHFEYADRIARGEIVGKNFLYNPPTDDFNDTYGHGTYVTGPVGADTNNGQGIAAHSWNHPIFAPKTNYYSSTTVPAIIWAVDNGARVINMSFGSGVDSLSQHDAIKYATSKGAVCVAAAGNSESDQPIYPAAWPEALAVTGARLDGTPTGNAFGDWIDLCATLGVFTTRTMDDNQSPIGAVGGTSMASPVVAAAAAMVLTVNPDLTPVQVMDILRTTAEDLGDRGFDVYHGYGRVNFFAAVQAAAGTAPPPADTTPPTTTIAAPADGTVASGTVSVIVDANDNVGVSRVDLYRDGSFVSSDTVAPHEWPVDTTTLPDGAHAFRARAYDAAGNSAESDPVTVNVDNAECADFTDCDDGDACTLDRCVDGQCSNAALSCDDGDALTVDSCDPATGCVHTVIDCDDGDACTTDAYDSSVGCTHTAVDCNDYNACTLDTCDSLTGCAYEQISCDDGLTTTVDTCDASVGCVNTPVDCDDGDACTADTLDEAGQCVHAPLDCDDGNACTTDTCNPSVGCVVTDVRCDDGDPCTTDKCDSQSGCVFAAVSCPESQACVDGACQASDCNANGVCDPGEDCTNCPRDCPTGQGSVCGNGICEAGNGEDCVTCPTDCNGMQTAEPSGRFCCGGGGGENPVDCGDARCNSSGFVCITPVVPDSCCGDGVCEGTETGCDCPLDCGAPDSTEVKGATCRDGLDNDCDGAADCDDADCDGESSCPTCLPSGSPCASDADCCTQRCQRNGRHGTVCK